MLKDEPNQLPTTMMAERMTVSKRGSRTQTDECADKKEHVEFLAKRTSKVCDEPGAFVEVRRKSTSSLSSSAGLSTASMETPASSSTQDEASRSRMALMDIQATTIGRHSPFMCQEDGSLGLPTTGRPVNFGVVVPGVYRSSYPQVSDYRFLEKLKLKTIVTLVQKDRPEEYKSFMDDNGIRHHVFDMKGTKKEEIPIKTMKQILRLVLDRQNHPLLIHCNHGKHRTGCVVGVVRKLSGWEVDQIVDEYTGFSQPKIRDCDVKYITDFQLASLSNLFARESTLQLRVRNFFRATMFSLFVLLLWLVSGSKLTVTKRAEHD